MEITHEQAIESARNISKYCASHFMGDERTCKDCVFQRKDVGRCILKYFIGIGGEEMFRWAYPLVKSRYEELTKK